MGNNIVIRRGSCYGEKLKPEGSKKGDYSDILKVWYLRCKNTGFLKVKMDLGEGSYRPGM